MTTKTDRNESLETVDQVIEWIRSAIEDGSLAPGEPLRQDHIAARFGSGKLPVREALRYLQGQGLVEMNPRRGFAVKNYTAVELSGIIELYAIVAAHAIQNGAGNFKLADLEELRRNITALEQAPDLMSALKADAVFHTTLLSVANTPIVTSSVKNFHLFLRMFLIASEFTEWLDYVPTYRAVVDDLSHGAYVSAASRLQIHLFDRGRALAAAAKLHLQASENGGA